MNAFRKSMLLMKFRKQKGLAPYRPAIIHRDVEAGLPRELNHQFELVSHAGALYRIPYAEELTDVTDKIFITDPEKIEHIRVIK